MIEFWILTAIALFLIYIVLDIFKKYPEVKIEWKWYFYIILILLGIIFTLRYIDLLL